MGTTKIEWTDATWNPVTGCSPISPGCDHCYAKRMANRLKGRYGYPEDEPFRPGTFHPEQMDRLWGWKKPRKIFVCSMGDIFHPKVRTVDLDYVWSTMGCCDSPDMRIHTFILLTKRPDCALKYAEYRKSRGMVFDLSNLWLGVTAENQEQADKRIPILLQIPAAVRFVSIEPMLGPIALRRKAADEREIVRAALMGTMDEYSRPVERGIDWVIVGGETGPGALPAKAEWFFSIIDQCKAAGVPVFVKKAPEGVPIIREFPS